MAEEKKVALLAESTFKGIGGNGEIGEWSEFGASHLDDYIKGFQGTTATAKTLIASDELADKVTGYPSAWARNEFVKLAFAATENDSLLGQIYENFRQEWMGLLATIAVHASDIEVSEPILLKNEESGFSLSDLLGKVLFVPPVNEKRFESGWYDKDVDGGDSPFIQLIKYRGQIIGATSPEVLIFPAVTYSCIGVKWFDDGNKESHCNHFVFNDDVLEDIAGDKRQLQDLYLLVSRVYKILSGKDDSIPKSFLNNPGIAGYLKDVTKKIEAIAKKNKIPLADTGRLSKQLEFRGWYSKVVSCEDKVYRRDGFYTYEPFGDPIEIENFWLPVKNQVCEIYCGDKKKEDLSTFVLCTTDGEKERFFTVPLSDDGMKEFCEDNKDDKASRFLGYSKGSDYSPTMTAVVDTNEYGEEVLHVTLTLFIKPKGDGAPVARGFEKYYLINKDECERSSTCVLWPNFISPGWKEYYLYTECVEKTQIGMMTRPFYYKYDSDNKRSFVKEGKKIVVGNTGRDASKWIWLDSYARSPKHVYDVWRSEKPIAGVAVSVKDGNTGNVLDCGYLLFRGQKSIDFLRSGYSVDDYKVVVGMDFGSNNSCVYFREDNRSTDMTDLKPLQFKNMRMTVFGSTTNDYKQYAEPHELLFFQNEEPKAQFKSWVLMSDPELEKAPDADMKPVSGGMNIFEPNIRIESIQENKGYMETDMGQLFYNMKWRIGVGTDTFTKQRTVYVRSLWLQILANLFAMERVPSQFVWSYPGAFGKYEYNALNQLYSTMMEVNPYTVDYGQVNLRNMTEAVAVKESLAADNQVQTGNIHVAMDIGGSTTDLLIWFYDKSNKPRYIQSSICLAAGQFANAFKNSPILRQTLVHFLKNKQEDLGVLDPENLNSKADLSYYFVNTVFDLLAQKDLKWSMDLYSKFTQEDNSRRIFLVPAYIGGFLSFYTGFLLQHLICTEMSQDVAVSNIRVWPVGKGSRILDWLKTGSLGGENECVQYLVNCMKEGMAQYRNTNQDGAGPMVPDNGVFQFWPGGASKDPKIHVARGLSKSSDARQSDVSQLILFGEAGIFNANSAKDVCSNVDLQAQSNGYYDQDFRMECREQADDKKFPIFKAFLKKFMEYARGWRLLDGSNDPFTPIMEDKFNSSKINASIKSRTAFRDTEFSFKESYLVLEAFYFLDCWLNPKRDDG